jgi:hypothetical protein
MFKLLIVVISAISMAFAKPTLQGHYVGHRHGTTFGDVLTDVADDMTRVVKSTAGVVTFVGETTANAGVEAGKTAFEYVNAIEVEAHLNATEDAVKANKVAMIESIFDVKRNALRAVIDFQKQYSAAMVAFLNMSIENVNAALVAAQQGISVSKEAVANIAAEVTIENAQAAVGNAQAAANAAIETSVTLIETTGEALVESLVKTKEVLHEAASNFNSQDLLHSGEVNLGLAINASFSGATSVADQFGVFDTIDHIVHSMVDIPAKMDTLLSTVGDVTITTTTDEEPVEASETEIITIISDFGDTPPESDIALLKTADAVEVVPKEIVVVVVEIDNEGEAKQLFGDAPPEYDGDLFKNAEAVEIVPKEIVVVVVEIDDEVEAEQVFEPIIEVEMRSFQNELEIAEETDMNNMMLEEIEEAAKALARERGETVEDLLSNNDEEDFVVEIDY